MSLEFLKSIFEIGGVALLALTFIFGAGALIVNNRLNAIQSKELDDFKLKFEGEQQKTALAQKEAAEAKTLAGGFERDIALANQKAAEAAERAEAEKLERRKLEAKVLPRRLTGEQKDEFAKLLTLPKSTAAGITIVSTLLDGDGSDFADDFESAFKAANWATLRIKNHVSDKQGVFLGTVEGTPVLPTTKLVEEALTAIRVPWEKADLKADDHSTSPWFQSGFLYLVIERKPAIKASATK